MDRAHRTALFAAISLAACAALWTSPVRAQACCTGTTGEDFSIVRRCATAVVAAQIGYEYSIGSFDADAAYRSLDGATVGAASLLLGAGIRLFPRDLQLHASIPMRLQHRRLQGLPAATALGVGDATAALRFTAVADRILPVSVSDPISLLPFVDVFAGTRMPTGKAPEDSSEPTGVDVTGSGAWAPFAGVKVTKFFGIHHAPSIEVRYAHPLPRRVDTSAGPRNGVAPGEEIAIKATWLYLHDLRWSAGVFSELQLTRSAKEDGQRIADSDTRRLRGGVHAAYVFDYPDWELALGIGSDAFFGGVSKNIPYAGPSATLTLTRQFR